MLRRFLAAAGGPGARGETLVQDTAAEDVASFSEAAVERPLGLAGRAGGKVALGETVRRDAPREVAVGRGQRVDVFHAESSPAVAQVVLGDLEVTVPSSSAGLARPDRRPRAVRGGQARGAGMVRFTEAGSSPRVRC